MMDSPAFKDIFAAHKHDTVRRRPAAAVKDAIHLSLLTVIYLSLFTENVV